jgi:regulator of replication initiation timing
MISYRNSLITEEFNTIQNLKLHNKDDLIDLYYTVINSGKGNFAFQCPEEYTNCIKDVIEIADDQNSLSNINGFVHPFNSFDTIETSYDSLGRVNLKIIKTYTDLEIKQINEKVEKIVKEEVKNETDHEKIIKILHDYIINNVKYDKERTDNNIIRYASNTAYGVLFEGYGICSGYSDTMALFLNYYNIPNYKVISENHVWNAVYINNNWYHLDLTWDDPILNTGDEILDHSYFLITTKKLKELDTTQHTFDETIFTELRPKEA